MLPVTWAVPWAACWTLRAISWVEAPCSSTADATVVAISEMRPIVSPISLMAATASCAAVCLPGVWPAALAGRFGGLGGELLDLLPHDREAPAGLAGARRLDGGVEREQVGLLGDRLNEIDDIADLAGIRRKPRDGGVGAARGARGFADHVGGAPDQRADFGHRTGQFFGRAGNRLHVAR